MYFVLISKKIFFMVFNEIVEIHRPCTIGYILLKLINWNLFIYLEYLMEQTIYRHYNDKTSN